MADVTGYVGDQRVEFNNAATEATLKLLLQSSIASNKQSLDQLKKMTQTGGILDSDAFDRVNVAVEKSGKSFADVEESARKVSITILYSLLAVLLVRYLTGQARSATSLIR